MKYEGFTEGTSSMSMGDYSTSGKAVTIGAWAAQNKSMDLDGKITTNNQFKVGDIAPFSSYGTDYAGHKIPDACTPGTNVVAAINSLQTDAGIEKDNPMFYVSFTNQYVDQQGRQSYYFAPMSGTSMATPTAAGIVALWVQAAKDKGKTLTNADVKDIILHSSDTDEGTAKAPHRFGAGKINAYRGLLYVLDLSTGIEGLSQQQPENVSFRVENGQLIAEGAEDGTAVTLYNLSGTIVSRTAVHAGRISLDGLRKGVYAVQLGKLGSTLIRL
jgi:subtilisin family serine protease